jgi:hypothetical protein
MASVFFMQANARAKRMSIRLHSILRNVLEAGAFITAILFALFQGPNFRLLGLSFPWSSAVVIIAAALTAHFVTRIVPAQCPKCGGQAYGRGNFPVIYRCRSCHYAHETDDYAADEFRR